MPPTRERALVSERQEASLLDVSIMLLLWLMEAKDGVRMGGAAVKQLTTFFCCCCGGIGLCCCDGAKGDEQGVVNGLAAVEQCANCFLKVGQFLLFKWFGFISRLCKLFFGAVDGFCPWVGCMLWFGRCRMHEAMKGFLNAPGHGDVNGAIFAVPVEVNAEEFCSGPVCGDLVKFDGHQQGVRHWLGRCA